MATKVKCKCVSKKEYANWGFDKTKESDRITNNPTGTEIELEVPYDLSSIYHKLSGGTNITLKTVNQEAADMFKIGSDFDLVITPSEE